MPSHRKWRARLVFVCMISIQNEVLDVARQLWSPLEVRLCDGKLAINQLIFLLLPAQLINFHRPGFPTIWRIFFASNNRHHRQRHSIGSCQMKVKTILLPLSPINAWHFATPDNTCSPHHQPMSTRPQLVWEPLWCVFMTRACCHATSRGEVSPTIKQPVRSPWKGVGRGQLSGREWKTVAAEAATLRAAVVASLMAVTFIACVVMEEGTGVGGVWG